VSRWSWAPWTLTSIFLSGLDTGNEGRIGYAVASSGPYEASSVHKTLDAIRWYEFRACQWLYEDRARCAREDGL